MAIADNSEYHAQPLDWKGYMSIIVGSGLLLNVMLCDVAARQWPAKINWILVCTHGVYSDLNLTEKYVSDNSNSRDKENGVD